MGQEQWFLIPKDGISLLKIRSKIERQGVLRMEYQWYSIFISSNFYAFHRNFNLLNMNSKTLLAILSLFCVILFFSCEEENVLDSPDRIVFEDDLDNPFLDSIVNSLEKESEYVRVTPMIVDCDTLPYHFIFGMKDYKLWLNVYDSTWVQVDEHSFPNQIEKSYHVGYGEYGKLCDAYLSLIHYDNHIKFLEVYIIYKLESSYAIRCQSLFIDNRNFVVVNDEIIGRNLDEIVVINNGPYNLRPHSSKEYLKPWINNSFLYINRINSQCICFDLEDYSILYKSEKGSHSGVVEVENAINYEEVIMVTVSGGADSPEVKRFNLKTGKTEWSFFIKDSDLVPQDAKCLSLYVVERRENEWMFASEWILFDGTHKELKFIINIDTGEYLTDYTLS